MIHSSGQWLIYSSCSLDFFFFYMFSSLLVKWPDSILFNFICNCFTLISFIYSTLMTFGCYFGHINFWWQIALLYELLKKNDLLISGIIFYVLGLDALLSISNSTTAFGWENQGVESWVFRMNNGKSWRLGFLLVV